MINAYNRFQTLIPKSTRSVVTITSNNGDGTSTATTLGGTTITVNGEQVTAGNKAFVQNGEVVRQAPSLSITELTI
tara:strand:- start:4448 stop:4675 length:228 start_codon:yes stop_codon:yes gene_type:complete